MQLMKVTLPEFKTIYEDMKLQFPANELKSLDYMEELLSQDYYTAWKAVEGDGLLGYIIVCSCNDSIFVEYVAVLQPYHSKGYGRKIILSLERMYPESAGCYFEVEPENFQDPNTVRRIRFYRNLGCRLVTKHYFLPFPGGSLPMNLFYLPYRQQTVLSYDQVFFDLQTIFSRIYSRLPEHTACLKKFQLQNAVSSFIL